MMLVGNRQFFFFPLEGWGHGFFWGEPLGFFIQPLVVCFFSSFDG